jgi:hypothetical protein
MCVLQTHCSVRSGFDSINVLSSSSRNPLVTIPFVLLIFSRESHVTQQLTRAQLFLNRRQFIAAAAPYGAAKPQLDYYQ